MYIQYTMLQMVVEKWKGTGILIKQEVFKQTYCSVALFLCTYGSCLLVLLYFSLDDLRKGGTLIS